MAKRTLDILLSFFGLLLLAPLFILISLWIIIDSPGKLFYKQLRVGKNNTDFLLYKFRTMVNNADKKGLLTIGTHDIRITRCGYYLRRYKLDELPQLFNVLIGNMSLVGPRPEVRKYVLLYTAEQKKVLSVKPGITDYASIAYVHENEILGAAENPESTYINEIMPAKLILNMAYINNPGIITDIKIILKTLARILGW